LALARLKGDRFFVAGKGQSEEGRREARGRRKIKGGKRGGK